MALPSVNVNELAVLAAAIVSMVIGALWYSPLLFGKAWMKLMGFSAKDMEKAKKKGMGKLYFYNFIAALVLACVLAWFIGVSGASGLSEGIIVAFWVWLGFIVSILIGGVLWEGRPFSLFLINISYWLVNLLANGIILAVWK